MSLKDLKALAIAVLFLWPTAYTIAQTDSLVTISTEKLRFFVSYYYKATALEKDTALLLSNARECSKQLGLHRQEKANLREISIQKNEQISILHKQVDSGLYLIDKLQKRNVFLKRFTITIVPMSFLVGAFVSYKAFH